MHRTIAIAILAAVSLCLSTPPASAEGGSGIAVWGGPVISPEADGSSYEPSNLFDGKLESAWCPRDAASAWFEVAFDQPRDVNMFFVSNGYQRTTAKGTDLFKANARFKTLVITNDRGESVTISLDDEKGEVQYFFSSSLPFAKGVSSLSFRAAGAYTGTKYTDVLISEIRLGFADTSEDEMVKGG